MRLTRSRLWIGLLAMMLVGIVALNVVALQFSASSSEAARQADELRQANSALRGDIATMHSNDKIAAAAAEFGLATPAPGDFRYLKASGDDAAEAARRLRSGELTDAVAPVAPAVTETVATETSAAPVIETAPVEVAPPVAEAPVAEEPVAEAPVAEAAAPSQSSTPASGGGVSP